MSAEHLNSVLLLKEKDGAALQVFKEALIVFSSGTLPICHVLLICLRAIIRESQQLLIAEKTHL